MLERVCALLGGQDQCAMLYFVWTVALSLARILVAAPLVIADCTVKSVSCSAVKICWALTHNAPDAFYWFIADMCTSRNPIVPSGPNGQTLAFVIQNTYSMATDIQQIQSRVQYFISQATQQSQTWFTTYVLVTYDSIRNHATVITQIYFPSFCTLQAQFLSLSPVTQQLLFSR